MELISEKLNNYLESTCDPEPPLLQEINRETHLKVLMPRMLSGHFQGRLLSLVSQLLRPKRILEIGTYTGYATLCLAEGLTEDGLIHTIDINEELEERVRGYFDRSSYKNKIKYHIADATKLIPDLDEEFDLVFIDADKKNNLTYYDLVMEKLSPGGVILTDNVLWSGKVPDEQYQDKDTSIIRKFNQRVASDPRVEKLILPVRDGIYVIRKK